MEKDKILPIGTRVVIIDEVGNSFLRFGEIFTIGSISTGSNSPRYKCYSDRLQRDIYFYTYRAERCKYKLTDLIKY